MTDKETKPLTVVQQLMQDVSDNPMQVKWPRDKWGITTALKKEVLMAGGSVRDNQEKHDTLLNTLAVAIAHVQKRRLKDQRVKAQRKASNDVAFADREPRQRVSARPVEAQ
jgi:hypothetical protein